jgi:5-methylcytosine-specific restriction endonuclease McrA
MSGIYFKTPEQWRTVIDKISLGLVPCPNCGEWVKNIVKVPNENRIVSAKRKEDKYLNGWTTTSEYCCEDCLSAMKRRKFMKDYKRCGTCKNLYLILKSERYEIDRANLGHQYFVCPTCQEEREYNKNIERISKKEKEKVLYQNARTRKLGLLSDLTVTEWMEVLDYHDWHCAYCKGEYTDMDHVIPILRGGGTTSTNVVPACGKCNSSKNALEAVDFLESRFISLYPDKQYHR